MRLAVLLTCVAVGALMWAAALAFTKVAVIMAVVAVAVVLVNLFAAMDRDPPKRKKLP